MSGLSVRQMISESLRLVAEIEASAKREGDGENERHTWLSIVRSLWEVILIQTHLSYQTNMVRKVKTSSLVVVSDVEEIWVLYVQPFEIKPGQLEAMQDKNNLENSGKTTRLEDMQNLGINDWHKMDNEKLNHLLQFPDGKPTLKKNCWFWSVEVDLSGLD